VPGNPNPNTPPPSPRGPEQHTVAGQAPYNTPRRPRCTAGAEGCLISGKKSDVTFTQTNIPRAALPAPSPPPAPGPQEEMTFVSEKKHHIAAYETNIPRRTPGPASRCTPGPTAPGPQEGMTFVSKKKHHIAAYDTNIPRCPAFSCSASGAMRNAGRRARPPRSRHPGARLKAAWVAQGQGRCAGARYRRPARPHPPCAGVPHLTADGQYAIMAAS
jgi:hypothetical protein